MRAQATYWRPSGGVKTLTIRSRSQIEDLCPDPIEYKLKEKDLKALPAMYQEYDLLIMSKGGKIVRSTEHDKLPTKLNVKLFLTLNKVVGGNCLFINSNALKTLKNG
tara:strand:- start:15323 stop:15643 length:321 start_codon:yes stop_codon:yes gene_type:complete